MKGRRAGLAIVRSAGHAVSVNLRTGHLRHTPPAIVYETTSKGLSKPAPLQDDSKYSLSDSIVSIERAVAAGELHVTNSVRNCWRMMNEQLEQEEEDLLAEAGLAAA